MNLGAVQLYKHNGHYAMKIINIPYYIATRIIKKIQSGLGLNTLGARAIVLDSDNRILLVKHTYQSHWYLPGGGVKKGESAKMAIIRELEEEVGLIINDEEPCLFGIYYHTYLGVNDYPVIYIVKNYSTIPAHSREIEQMDWFDYANLPQTTSPGTQRRLNEYFSKALQSDAW